MWSLTDKESALDSEISNDTNDVMNTEMNNEMNSEISHEIETLGLVAKFRQKLFASRTASASKGLVVLSKRDLSLSRTAELLLISRLKARSPSNQTAGMLERAAHIVFVTCKNWFSDSTPQRTTHRHTSI